MLPLPDTDAIHHVGNHRLYVQLARALALEAWRVIRFGLSGLGESPARPGEPADVGYGRHALDDVAAVVTAARAQWPGQRMGMLGLCAGGYHALRSAVQGLGLAEVLVVNPLVLHWHEGMTLDAHAPQVQETYCRARWRNARERFLATVSTLVSEARSEGLQLFADPPISRVLQVFRRPAPMRDAVPSTFRLITRSDFDGLVSAVLLTELGLIDDIKFVHPKDMQDGKIAVTHRDITTNLPYVPGVHLAFDHHESETLRNTERAPNHIIHAKAPSAARVVYEYYGGAARFPMVDPSMMTAVDQADSAQYSREDILEPKGWVLLNYLMDARTGLGRFRDFRISNYQLMMELIEYCRTHGIHDILGLPDVKERVALYIEHADKAREQILRCSTVHGNLVVLDLRHEETIWATNRFMIYALFPQCNISIHTLWGLKQQNTVFATGKSILDRSSKTHVGALMLEYGGGGHQAAGTCQIDNNKAESVLRELITRINADG